MAGVGICWIPGGSKIGLIMNRWNHKYDIALRALQIGLGVLFIFASYAKILSPGEFAKSIANYQILPTALLHLSAIILPWLELVCGVALIINKYPRAANLLIGLMTIIFTTAIISAMARGLDINCGCFSLVSDESDMNLAKVLQNLGIILSSLILEIRFRRSELNN